MEQSLKDAVVRNRGLVGFTAAYWLFFSAWGFFRGNALTIPYLITVAGVAAIVAAFDARFDLGPAVLWSLSALGFAHMAGGFVEAGGEGLYYVWLIDGVLRYDQLVHALGTAAATLACGRVLAGVFAGKSLAPAYGLVTALAGIGIAAVQEAIEFLATQLGPYDVGGFENTGWDLVANAVGACAAAVYLARRLDRPSDAAGSRAPAAVGRRR